MTRYITICLTLEQAQAASNACDLIADSLDADGRVREASLYQRASKMLDAACNRRSLRIVGNKR